MSTNRLRVTSVKEVTVGTTPTTPRMRQRRLTGEGLNYTPVFEQSDELRDDGMNGQPIKVGEDSNGPINFELSYPFPNSPEATDIESALHNEWVNTPSRDNDGTADSVITGVAATGGIFTVVTGPAFVANHLVKSTGFTNAGNNRLSKLTTGSATVPAVGDGILTDEAAPPATARLKAVGFEGDAGDIETLADGLKSTTLDFTTFNLPVGSWIKVGGTADASTFAFLVTAGAKARAAAWARVSGAVTAHKIPLDNLPSGWSVDAGAAKTIRVFFGDTIKNGTTQIGQTIERGFMYQSVPTYLQQPGMVANAYNLNIEAKRKITGNVSFMGMAGASQGTVSLDASPDAPRNLIQFPVMAGSANVGRIGEGGATATAPNFVRQMGLSITNPLTEIEDVTQMGAAGIGSHQRQVTVQLQTRFGSNALMTKFFNGDATSVNTRVVKENRALVFQVPALVYDGDGSPNAGGKNQDVMLPLRGTAFKDESVTGAMVLIDRFEYVE